MRHELTGFQVKCLAKIFAMEYPYVDEMRVHYEVRASESFLIASVHGAQIYIYADEVQFEFAGKDYRFETPDYDTEEAMIEDFAAKYVETVS